MRYIIKLISGLLFVTACLYIKPLSAQKASIKAIVKDTAAKRNLEYAVIALFNTKDSLLVTSTRSLHDGSFLLEELKSGSYSLLITYPQMADFIIELNLRSNDTVKMGNIIMTSKYRLLEEVIVKSTQAAIRMKGDTLEYKADSFAVRQGASVEELLKRLPGIEVNKDGTIKAQGEKVAQVFVDGDEFFGDDPTMATKYLQASSVDKVQVYDKKSEQAEFTGIDDGKRSKTINIKLKENSKKGYFGKLSAGINAKDSYSNQGMFNRFRNKQKLSVFSSTSNTGVTGISFSDRFQFMGSDYESIDDNSAGLFSSDDYDGERYYGSGQPRSVNAGVQFLDKWKEGKQKMNGNYRFNTLSTSGINTGKSTQILPDSSARLSINSSISDSRSNEQKAAGSFDAEIDSFASIKIYSGFAQKEYSGQQENYSETKNGTDNHFLNQSNQNEFSNGKDLKLNNSILWRQKFRKEGRTLSLNLQHSYSKTNGILQTESNNLLYDVVTNLPSQEIVAQQQQNKSLTNAFAGKIAYSEKLSKVFSLQLAYAIKLTKAEKERAVYEKNINGKYENFIDSLSSSYLCNITSHLPSVTFQITKKKYNFSVGGNLIFTSLEQSGVNSNLTNRSFLNFAPQVKFQFKLSQLTSLHIRYDGNTRQPSIDQLQPLKDKSNPFVEKVGNPDLKPSFNNNFSLYFFKYSMKNFSNMHGSINYYFTQNAITTNQEYGQFNKTKLQYLNVNGNNQLYAYFGYERNFKKANLTLGSNVSFSNYAYNSFINSIQNKSKNNNLRITPKLKYEKLNKFNFSIESSINYTSSKSNIGNNLATTFWSHSHTVTTSVFLPWKLELSSDASLNFQPYNAAFNSSVQVIKWNAAISKKLSKDGKTEARLAVFDILNQNTGYNRYASGSNISESTSTYIPRYGLFSLVWNFTHTNK